MTFNQPVKIVISGKAGKRAAWTSSTGQMTDIALCDNINVPTVADNSECYGDNGADLWIWTKHFTSFSAYTPAAAPAPARTNSGGSCGGSLDVTCGSWSTCVNGKQSRDCIAGSSHYTATQDCVLETAPKPTPQVSAPVTTPTANTNNVASNDNAAPAPTTPNSNNGITGNVVSNTGSGSTTMIIAIVLAVIVMGVLVYMYMKNHK